MDCILIFTPWRSGTQWTALWLGAVVLASVLASPLAAEGRRGDKEESGLRYGFEVKANYRDSEATRFEIPKSVFDFPPSFLPVGQELGRLETVDPDGHGELSVATLWLEADFWRHFAAKAKVDFENLYDRNPTSSGRDIDIDELWLRWGEETKPATLPEQKFGGYVKLGKFAKFERQNDRHLESYGLVSTAFNRAEDVGVEFGFDLWSRLYAKVSYTQGNPLFFRDPNALAGDNGIPLFLEAEHPDPELKSGYPILYDADVNDIDFDNIETGVGIGFRLGGNNSSWSLDLLAWAYERELAAEVDLPGTFYGGDLDLLRGPGDAFPLGITHSQKQEWGGNLWFYSGDFTLFAQYVDQDVAGLRRTGFEAEVSYTFEMPYWGALGGRQIFSSIQPAVRYSQLDNKFGLVGPFPAPSVTWDWTKLDIGLRLALIDRLLDLTVEWNDNEFQLANGNKLSNDEFLATLRVAMDWGGS